ncbi:MAG: 3-hydroxyacyl-CoA dehydrogenase/enoyl-CoA hydratase family protein, partial [Archaeoglobaceae archaeon]
ESEVMSLAKQLSEMPPISLKAAKFAINFGYELPTDVGKVIEVLAFGLATSTQDVIEGISAFFQRRKPEFKGK